MSKQLLGKCYRLASVCLGVGVGAIALRASYPAVSTSDSTPPALTRPIRDRSAPPSALTVAALSSDSQEVENPYPQASSSQVSSKPQHCPFTPTSPGLSAEAWQSLTGWREQLNHSGQAHLSLWRSTLAAYSQPKIWPEIHDRARLAKVPIVMYHDVLPETEVFFDITPERLEADFQLIQEQNLTPISLDQLVSHLRAGVPLPPKPVVLTFDDGYIGHYDHVYKLLKQYRYPAAFSVFPDKIDGKIAGRSTLTWEQLQEMARNPLVTIVSHSVTHPSDLRTLSDADLRYELQASKRRLESQLGMPIRYFTYPEGNYDERVVAATEAAGYMAALKMDNVSGQFAGDSENLLTLERFGESRFEEVIEAAWGGPMLPGIEPSLNFAAPIQRVELEIDEIPLTLITGGRPLTIHADSRYSVAEIIANTEVVAAVDGAFFSLEYLDSNTMIGPVLSQNTGEFVPSDPGDVNKLGGRPLVLLGPQAVQFIPFDPAQHNTLTGLQQEMPGVTDAFVGAAWLVHQQKAQTAESFKNLFAFDALRHRAFWGINQRGQPVIGVSHARVDSVSLSQLLERVGFQEAVMLDSGVSTSLVYQGESLMGFESRPVPHVVALTPPRSCRAAR